MSRLSLDSTLTPEGLAEIRRHGSTDRERRNNAVLQEANIQAPRGKAYKPVALYANPRVVGPRWPFAVMRIKRILEGVARSSSIVDAVNGAEYKTLAKKYVETYAYYLMRSKAPPANGRIDHNPFRYLSDEDAFKKFVRCVEDICDESTKFPGLNHWYSR